MDPSMSLLLSNARVNTVSMANAAQRSSWATSPKGPKTEKPKGTKSKRWLAHVLMCLFSFACSTIHILSTMVCVIEDDTWVHKNNFHSYWSLTEHEHEYCMNKKCKPSIEIRGHVTIMRLSVLHCSSWSTRVKWIVQKFYAKILNILRINNFTSCMDDMNRVKCFRGRKYSKFTW